MCNGAEDSPPRIITITVGEERGQPKIFYAPAGVLCRQSAFFKAALNGAFAEAQQDSVALPEDDPVRLEQVLCWMYGQQDISLFKDFSNSEDLKDDNDGRYLENICDFLVLADKLLIDPPPASQLAETMLNPPLTAKNIRCAYSITLARPIATLFAEHSVYKYMCTIEGSLTEFHDFEFAKELEEVPGYVADLLGLVRHAMCNGAKPLAKSYKIAFKCRTMSWISERWVR